MNNITISAQVALVMREQLAQARSEYDVAMRGRARAWVAWEFADRTAAEARGRLEALEFALEQLGVQS